MTNREAIFQIVDAFGMIAASAIRQALSWNQIDLSIEEINRECEMLLAEDRIYKHNHPNWNEPLWIRPETSKAMMKLWGHHPA